MDTHGITIFREQKYQLVSYLRWRRGTYGGFDLPVGVVDELRLLLGEVGEGRVVGWAVRRVGPVVEGVDSFAGVATVLSEPADRTGTLPHLKKEHNFHCKRCDTHRLM